MNALTTTGTPTGFGLMFNQTSLKELNEFCAFLADSDYVPKSFKGRPGDIMVVGAMGARLGVDIFSALAGIAPINGKPSVYGDLMLAVCQNHAQYEDCLEQFAGTFPNDDYTARSTVKRKGKEPRTEEFSIGDAKRAGLWGKTGPWTSTPKRMLMMRARAFALRGAFADALAGFHAREELEDIETVTGEVTGTELNVKAGKARKTRAEPEPAAALQEPADAKPAQGTTAERTEVQKAADASETAQAKPAAATEPAQAAAPTYEQCKALAESTYKEGEPVRGCLRPANVAHKLNGVGDLADGKPAGTPERRAAWFNDVTAAAAKIRAEVAAKAQQAGAK